MGGEPLDLEQPRDQAQTAHLDIPKAVLTDRLNGLVADGLLQRTPGPTHAGRHLYDLTPAGRDLWPALHALITWGSRHRATNSRIFKHAACGTLLDDAGYCPRCGLTPEPEDITTEPSPRRKPGRTDPVAIALRAPHRLLEPLKTS